MGSRPRLDGDDLVMSQAGLKTSSATMGDVKVTASFKKPRLFIHIGPFKTGTTSVQEHFWHHRKVYLDKYDLLYPRTGLVNDAWGHRHLRLAREFRPAVWSRLSEEIRITAPSRVLISSERLSTGLAHLREAQPLISEYDPTLILVLRDEVALVRSMYLQVVKGYFSDPNEATTGQISFRDWWMKARERYIYGRMIKQWAAIFDSDRMEIVVFPKRGKFDSVSEMCKILDVPLLQQIGDKNPSISPFAARSAVFFGRWSRETGNRAMKLANEIERYFSALRHVKIPGFDPGEISEYYLSKNEEALRGFPKFARQYVHLHGANVISGQEKT